MKLYPNKKSLSTHRFSSSLLFPSEFIHLVSSFSSTQHLGLSFPAPSLYYAAAAAFPSARSAKRTDKRLSPGGSRGCMSLESVYTQLT